MQRARMRKEDSPDMVKWKGVGHCIWKLEDSSGCSEISTFQVPSFHPFLSFPPLLPRERQGRREGTILCDGTRGQRGGAAT